MKKSALHVLWVSMRGYCPNCEQGRVLKTPFSLKEKCPVCGVRFERSEGEGTGAMMLTISLVPLPVILLMFFLLTRPGAPAALIVIGSMLLVIVACLIFYPLARCLWLGVTYLGGGLQTDEEYAAKRAQRKTP
jgi:uncharacterized protein (DUF983 family)